MDRILGKEKIQNYILFILLLQPFIDIYRTFFQGTYAIAGFSIEEFVNIALISILGIFVLIEIFKSHDTKRRNFLIIYALICGVYLVGHLYNSSKFDESLFRLSDQSMIRNLYYLLRIYGLPIVLMVGVFVFPIDKKKFITTIQTYSLIVCGIIVLSNITQTSLVSYSEGTDQIIGGIFQWGELHSESYFEAYTSKGFFYSANQLSSCLFAMMPIVSYAMIRKCNWFSVSVVVIQMLAMLMIGTRTAALGTLIAFAVMILAGLVLFLIHSRVNVALKTKQIKTWWLDKGKGKFLFLPLSLAILIGGVSLYQVSPTKQRLDYLSYLEGADEREEKHPELEMSDAAWIQYIDEFYWFFYINKQYLEVYPVEDNLSFWVDMVKRDRTLNRDNRNFKVELNDEIIRLNNNSLDKVFGVGYTSNLLYTEKDYYYQYEIMGIGGIVLFMMPYVALVLYSAVMILKNFKRKANLLNVALGLGMCIYFVVAYIAGHTFGILYNMLFMALYTGMLVNQVRE